MRDRNRGFRCTRAQARCKLRALSTFPTRMGTIYRKTAEGQAEIETRVRKLIPRLRSALIMVDGKRTDEDLRKLLPQQAAETLQTLVEQGLIEPMQTSPQRATARPTSAPAPAPAASAAPAPEAPVRDFATLRREAVRAVNELLGPMGEMVALKLEQAKTPEDLRNALERAVTVIGNARGGAAAVQFARQFIETPPG